MAAKPITIHAAKTHLSRLIDDACAGREVIIARGKVPVVRLVPISDNPPVRRFGAMRGVVTVDDAFFDPLSEAELSRWEGKEK